MSVVRRAAVVLALVGFAVAEARAQEIGDEDFGLRVTLDRPGFVPGENVVFRIQNENPSPFTLKLSGLKVWRGERIAYSARRDLSDVRLEPGKTYTGTWNQKDNQGRPVSPGVYRLSVYATDHGLDDVFFLQVRVSFTIHRSTPNPVIFHRREPRYSWYDFVTFYVINRGSSPITLPDPSPWVVGRLRGTSRRVIYDPSHSGGPVVLRPGEFRVWSWDAKVRGAFISEGRYRITLKYRTASGNEKERFTDFTFLNFD